MQACGASSGTHRAGQSTEDFHSPQTIEKKNENKNEGAITFIYCTKIGLGSRRSEQLGPSSKFTEP